MYTCIVFLYVTSGIDMQCIYVHLSIVKQIMEAGESIEKTEGVDRYAAMSFAKNTTSEKNSSFVVSCVLTVLQIQIHIRTNYFYNTINRVYYAPVYVKM